MENHKTRLKKLERITPPTDEVIRVNADHYTEEEWQKMIAQGEIIKIVVGENSK